MNRSKWYGCLVAAAFWFPCGTAAAADEPARITAAPSWIDLEVGTVEGHVDIDVDGLPALPSPRFVTSALRDAKVSVVTLGVDSTPATPYDDLSQVRYRGYAEGALFRIERYAFDFVVRAVDGRGGAIRVYAGPDLDRDGLPEASEERCRGASAAISECVFHMDDVYVNQRWWYVVQRASGETGNVRLEAATVQPGCAPDCTWGGNLYATGPGHVGAGEPFKLRFAWDAPSLARGTAHLGLLYIQYVPGNTIRTVPVRVVARDIAATPQFLKDELVYLQPGERHDRLFVDVPPRTNSWSLTSYPTRQEPDESGSGTLQISYVGPVRAGPWVGSAPTPTGTSPSLTNPEPGRYFVTLENTGDTLMAIRLVAGINPKADAPNEIAPGSYYNPARPGHGVFLYPAGPDGALLWYTYREDGTPTWYYAQGPRTGSAPFVWPLYRAAWDGVTRHLAPVGRVALSNRTTSGGITFTYELDGETGSEALRPWLEGCGSLDGAPVDANGHWFDPAMPGYGFSAQTHPDYEFIASFLFDANGEPRFLAAERGGAFDAAASPVPLYQLKGFAPTAPWTSPVRTDVGVLGRIYSEAGIDQIAVEATYVDGVPGTWSSSAPVRQLGEPVGCP